MIPTVQFDPGTLAIWTTTGLLQEPDASLAAHAMRMAVAGEDPCEVLDDIPEDDPQRVRLVWLMSAVWHEKRHYFDTCLTNYGARRFRDLFSLAANYGVLVKELASRGEPLWLPVEIYADPIQRAVRGIAEPSPNVVEFARRTKMLKKMMAELDAPSTDGKREIHFGGEAQMEGLAQISQLHSIEYSLGMKDLYNATTRYVHRLPEHGPYRAIESVAAFLGCTGTTPKGITYANAGLAAALFATALCGQFFGHGSQIPTEVVSPAHRLWQMLEALGQGVGRTDMEEEECAEIVDQLARRLWGRTALEEIAADIDATEERVNLKDAPWLAVESLHNAFLEFIALRRRLLNAVRSSGSQSLLPKAFPIFWRDQLRPAHVTAWPRGSASQDGKMILGRKLNLPQEIQGMFPETVGLAWLSTAGAKEPFSPHNEAAWLEMLQRHSPRALLMLNGRQHRRMVPYDLELALAQIERSGMDVRFHPRFEWPLDRENGARTGEALQLAEFSGRNSFTCDLTGDQISPSESAVLTPWEFRRSNLVKKFQEATGVIGQIQLMTDWSDWIVRADLLN